MAFFVLTDTEIVPGTLYARGIQDYFEWLEEAGGVEGRHVELVFQDYGYKVDQAEQLYTRFVQEGGGRLLRLGDRRHGGAPWTDRRRRDPVHVGVLLARPGQS